MGTPLYMSPEQVEGKPVDPRTDIYSFGVTCYHMLAGQPPFRGSTAFEVALQHVRAEAAPLGSIRPDLPPELCAIVHKMMAKDPAQRHQTGRELLKGLARVRDTLAGVTGYVPLMTAPVETLSPAAATAPSSASVPAVAAAPQPSPRRRHGLLAAFVLSLAVALAAGAALGVWRQRRSPAPETVDAGAEVSPARETASLAKREDDLRATVDRYLDPANTSKHPETGVRLCLDLALPYLEQNRIDEAEQLFRRLAKLKQPAYHIPGVLGRAIVLALRDKAVASNDLFKTLQRKGKDASKPRRVAGLFATTATWPAGRRRPSITSP